MKLVDLMGKTLPQLTEDMEVLEFKPHANTRGEVMSLEIKLVPKDVLDKIPEEPMPRGGKHFA